MKKYGFTLAEILITLGIIGIVAAVTAPTFVSNAQNSSNAARLSATVSTLENAFTTMIVKEDADNLFETRAWAEDIGSDQNFAGRLGEYLTVSGFRALNSANALQTNFYGNGNGPYIMNTNGSKNPAVNAALAGNMVHNNTRSIELKNGATVFLTPQPELAQDAKDTAQSNNRDDGGALYSSAADIYIDVNGVAAPNVLGRDIFGFILGENGKLYPLGGQDAAVFNGNNNLWNVANSDWLCLDGDIDGGGYGCAARVVAEGYKINY